MLAGTGDRISLMGIPDLIADIATHDKQGYVYAA